MRHVMKAIRDRIGLGRFPVGRVEDHLAAAARWILQAQNGTPDDGVAHSWDVKRQQWIASYPETTGYIIPTLYDYAKYFGEPQYAEAALKMAEWEVAVQLPDGGVRAGTMAAEVVAPTIFNTGQVLFGLARAAAETGDEAFMQALRSAADWLVAAQDDDGCWRRFHSPFTTTKTATYNTRTAFGLVRAFEVIANPRYLDAADRNVRWALGQALPNGWLRGNCLTENADDSALTHTIAYSIRGFTEVGAVCANQGYLDHAIRMARAVAATQRSDGSLPGYITPQWRGKTRWSCVTGNSQMALNWFRLSRLTGDRSWIDPAVKANRFNMSLQDRTSIDPGVRGGLKGSHPFDGGYMTYRYPNWAAKFFMDALMFEVLGERVDNLG